VHKTKFMDKRLTVDLPEDVHKELVKRQLETYIRTDKKPALSEMIKDIIIESLEQEKASQN
jgi:hypothetical protein